MIQHAGSTDYQEVKMFAEDKAGRELRLENRKAAMLSPAATLALPAAGVYMLQADGESHKIVAL